MNKKEIINLPGDRVIYKFEPKMEAVIRVKPGDTLKVDSNDCFYQQIFDESHTIEGLDFNRVNPATGPIYIEGAEPGDLLKVEIVSIDVKDKGVAATIPGGGLLGDQVKESVVRIIDVKDGYADFQGVKLPLKPMIGVIGVAPADEDGPWPTDTPWKHGGNMDTTDIRPGSTLYFPVNQEGALLALGDCHAAMADGEMCFTGLEIPADVVIELDLIKGKTSKWPLIETEEATMINASGDDLEMASYEAANQAVRHLKEGLGIQWEDAYILGSLAVDLKISQLVDPKVTVRAAIPKHILSTEDLIEKSC